jgi:mannosyltransferase OCH1-like enzyme
VIPRTIHQIWIGPDPLPDDQRPWIESWKRHHPSWEHRLWTEETLPEDPIRPEIFERLRAPVERADILRLEILYRHGGVYVDTDLECLRPIDDVLEGEEFVGVNLKPGRATNTLIASAPGHPLLETALRSLRPMDAYWTPSSKRSIKEAAGPPLLRSVIREYPDVRMLEPSLCFPTTPEERQAALAVHHMARSWHNETTLRVAMLRAEGRLEEARASLERERRRHAATQKQLARAERRAGKEQSPRAGIRRRLGRRRSA